MLNLQTGEYNVYIKHVIIFNGVDSKVFLTFSLKIKNNGKQYKYHVSIH